MHAQINANTVACAVVIIQTLLPECVTGEDVEITTCCAFGESYSRQSDMTFKDKGETLAHFRIWFSDRYRPRHICCAVLILRAAINQEERAFGEFFSRRFTHAVMHNRAIRACTRNALKAEVFKLPRLVAEMFELSGGINLVRLSRLRGGIEPV